MKITISGDDPKNLKAILELQNKFEKNKPVEALDELVFEYERDDEENAPVMTFRNETTGEIFTQKIKNYTIKFPTTFYPWPDGIICLIGKEPLKIGGKTAAKSTPHIQRRMERENLSLPNEIHKAAIEEIIALNVPQKGILIESDFKTREVAAALGVGQHAIRHHLRNLQAEGVNIGNGGLWGSEPEFRRICNLIKPRLGAHGRRK